MFRNPVHTDRSFATIAGVLAVLSLLPAYGNIAAIWMAAGGNPEVLSDPIVLLQRGEGAADWWRLAMLLDIFGYYLPIVPLIVALGLSARKDRPEWGSLAAVFLLAYALSGALGAATLATASPPQMAEYATATPIQREVIEAATREQSRTVFDGVWSLYGELLAGLGWLILSRCRETFQRRWRLLTLAAGIGGLATSVGTIVEAEAIASLGLALYLLLAPIWAVWSGFSLLRARAPAAADANGRAFTAQAAE